MKLIWTNLFISRSNSSTSFMKSYDKPRDTHTTWHDVTLTHHVTGSLSRALKSKNHSKCIFSKNYFNVSGLQSLASDFSVFNDNVLSNLNEYCLSMVGWSWNASLSKKMTVVLFSETCLWIRAPQNVDVLDIPDLWGPRFRPQSCRGRLGFCPWHSWLLSKLLGVWKARTARKSTVACLWINFGCRGR